MHFVYKRKMKLITLEYTPPNGLPSARQPVPLYTAFRSLAMGAFLVHSFKKDTHSRRTACRACDYARHESKSYRHT